MPTGTWPIKSSDQFSTTCSQCHTAIATTGPTGPVVCPRCHALIEAADGQPFGTPIYVSPISDQPLAASIDPGWPDEDHPLGRYPDRLAHARPDPDDVLSIYDLETQLRGLYNDDETEMDRREAQEHAEWLADKEARDAVQEHEGPANGSEEAPPV